jgi:dihydrofolate reductase
MRNVVLYTLLSVDGVAEAPDRFVFDFDDVMYDNLARVVGAQDTVLLGRRMYDEWAEFWPHSDDQPFADFINSVEKYVVTSSAPTRDWTNAHVADRPLPELVQELKRRDGGDIGVHGSVELARSMLAGGLVDDLRLVVAPTLAGPGRRLFDGIGAPRRIELVRSTPTPSGSLLLDYRLTPGQR